VEIPRSLQLIDSFPDGERHLSRYPPLGVVGPGLDPSSAACHRSCFAGPWHAQRTGPHAAGRPSAGPFYALAGTRAQTLAALGACLVGVDPGPPSRRARPQCDCRQTTGIFLPQSLPRGPPLGW
jgi:hypothetical protein